MCYVLSMINDSLELWEVVLRQWHCMLVSCVKGIVQVRYKVLRCCHAQVCRLGEEQLPWINCWRVFSDNGIVDDLAQAQLGGCAGCVCGRSCDSSRISDKQSGGE